MNFLLAGIVGVVVLIGGMLSPSDTKPFNYNGSDSVESINFGAISFPTSLDSFTNPSGTDSVATVSHSGQHSNANDAIEALEAKVGIGASTPIANAILAGTSAGTSFWSTFATTTSLVSTNILANGSSTFQSLTSSSSTIPTFLASNATSTNLHVSNLASTTQVRANTGIIGNLTAGNINVTTCTGCSSGVGSWYFATTTNSRYLAKTLALNAGDTVFFGVTVMSGTNQGSLAYRMSSPFIMATTTVADMTSVADDPTTVQFSFQATTTSTVTFEAGPGDAGQTKSMWIQVLANGFSNSF